MARARRDSKSEATSTTTRPIIGPLTTEMTMPKDCAKCVYDRGDQNIRTKGGIATITWCRPYLHPGCNSATTCLPASWGFHSPGLSCPVGWTTATTLSYGMSMDASAEANRALDFLEPDETAAFCCPNGFDIYVQPSGYRDLFLCESIVTSGEWHAYMCDGTSESFIQEPSIENMGHSVFPMGASGPSGGLKSAASTRKGTPNQGISAASPVQLIWRRSDRKVSNTAFPSSTTTTFVSAPPPPSDGTLSHSALYGIIAACVVVSLLCGAVAGIWIVKFLRRCRQQRGPTDPNLDAAPPTGNPEDDTSDEKAVGSMIGPSNQAQYGGDAYHHATAGMARMPAPGEYYYPEPDGICNVYNHPPMSQQNTSELPPRSHVLSYHDMRDSAMSATASELPHRYSHTAAAAAEWMNQEPKNHAVELIGHEHGTADEVHQKQHAAAELMNQAPEHHATEMMNQEPSSPQELTDHQHGTAAESMGHDQSHAAELDLSSASAPPPAPAAPATPYLTNSSPESPSATATGRNDFIISEGFENRNDPYAKAGRDDFFISTGFDDRDDPYMKASLAAAPPAGTTQGLYQGHGFPTYESGWSQLPAGQKDE
ncbi:hypothetical protein B0H66DRAFT_640777 [Apodospora peruviana]|uniref:Uncharacterized protein n=1 Tax=Apodospora peruviana TaxID=516989 RepID=A0AAE0I1H2_9PEZI|nr:hypothetical protein B0H66DRAFT_640777 [Apodospora peruviana]